MSISNYHNYQKKKKKNYFYSLLKLSYMLNRLPTSLNYIYMDSFIDQPHNR